MSLDILYCVGQTGTLTNTDSIALIYPNPEYGVQSRFTGRAGVRMYPLLKRIMDITLSILGLMLLSPVLLATAAAIKLDSKGSAIYAQERIGKNGKPFIMYKFRSMSRDAHERLEEIRHLNEIDGPAFKMRNDPRVTRVGRFIRRTSIDELPQLINILRGEMSLVGPRPPLMCEVRQYAPHHRLRLEAMPGLTCYWQIGGRSDVSFDQWVDLDLRYIKEQSLLADIKIIIRTIPVVITGKGAC